MRILVSVSRKVTSLWRGQTPSLGENPLHLSLLMCDPKHEKPLLTGVIIRQDAGLKWVLKGKTVKKTWTILFPDLPHNRVSSHF